MRIISQEGAGGQSPRKRLLLIILFLFLPANLAQGGPVLPRPDVAGAYFEERPEKGSPLAQPHLAPQAVPTTLYSHGDPTDEEQLMLELINRARANPPAEGIRLADTSDPDVQEAMDFFKVDRAQLRADFASYPTQPPLAFNPKLLQAARGHSNDMATHDFQEHIGSDGSAPSGRINATNYIWQSIGENIFAYSQSVFYGHAGFLVDWGVPSLGHRQNAINFDGSNRFREVGIGIVHEGKADTQVGPLVVTQDFAEPMGNSNVFLVGVVFEDSNANDFYDPGEGRPGVTILPDKGTYYAVTSASGGYAIRIEPGTGEVTLSVGGGGFPEQSRVVTIGPENIKADFVSAPPPLPHAISGRVKLSGAGLAGVTVSVGERSTMTQADGRYLLMDIPDGTYTLTATSTGFQIVPINFSNPIAMDGRDLSDLDFTATLLPQDVPPEDVTLLSVAEADGEVTITWENPPMEDLDHIRLLRRGDRFPTAPTDPGATIAFEGNATQFTDGPLANGSPYYYGIYTVDTSGNFSAGRFFTAAPANESGFDRLLVTQLKATVKGPGKDSLALTARFNHAGEFEASDRLTVEVGDQIFWETAGFIGQGSLKSTHADGSKATVNNRTHLITISLKKQDLAGKLSVGKVRVRVTFGRFDAALTVPLDAKLFYTSTSRAAPSEEVFVIQSALLKDVAADKGDSFSLSGSWSAPDLFAAFDPSVMPMSFRIKSGDRVIFESLPDQFSSRSNWALSPGKSLVFTRPKTAEGKAGVQKMTILLSNRSFKLFGNKANLSTFPLSPTGTTPATLIMTVGGSVYRTDILLMGNGAGSWKY